jgi:hypothetical protein
MREAVRAARKTVSVVNARETSARGLKGVTNESDERERLGLLAEAYVDRLEFVDAVLLFALVKLEPDRLALELARLINACAELEGLAEECRGLGE